MPASKPVHVLDGYKVLDFTQALAGPTVTRLMAELGAKVIKVEIPPKGDFSRALPFLKDGRSAYFVQQNRGKKSLCIDPKKPDGLAILKRLLPEVDVLVENYSPGAIARMGLGWEAVHKINPRLIMCSVSAFGQSGPLANRPGYDYIGMSYAGVTYMIGDPNGPPSFPMLGLGDVSTGVHALASIACALLYRDRSGKGQHLDISLVDSYFHCHELNVQMYSASGGKVKPKRPGLQHTSAPVIGIFRGKAPDSYFFIMAPVDHQFAELCRTMGRPELATDSRFATVVARAANLAEITGIIQSWLDVQPDDATILRTLEDHRIPVAPILSIEEAVNHPHLRQRRTVRKIRDRFIGEYDIPGVPLRFSDFPNELELEAPLLGEHNGEILGGLGYSENQVRELQQAGVLGSGAR
jgi:crotonobetainyl-CoA:carnitine CoA-transferase CaiB-like acyl-CoA transferase